MYVCQLSLLIWAGYRHFKERLPEAICCCLQTCNVDVVLLVMYFRHPIVQFEGNHRVQRHLFAPEHFSSELRNTASPGGVGQDHVETFLLIQR